MTQPATATKPGWLARVPYGDGGVALDLGGRHGELSPALTAHGYTYINVDLHPAAEVRGDAHRLPFRSGVFNLVVSIDTLEHFARPWEALAEVHRVLAPGGVLAVSVPWMHPFHGDDLWRYSPLGLRRILDEAGMTIEHFEPVHGLFTLFAVTFGARLGPLSKPTLRWAKRADNQIRRRRPEGEGTAHAFFVVARKITEGG